MKVILFGATGMIGQGALRECLLDKDVESVLSIGRHSTGKSHEKLRELNHQDFTDFSTLEKELSGYDACFFCLGASSVGLKEEEYARITYGFTLAAAQVLVKLNPQMVFIYVSGIGADSSERGPIMWARVRGKTENALLQLPFRAVYIFRPAMILPKYGVTSRTRLYRVFYKILGPLYPIWKYLFPNYVSTTEQMGIAMLKAAKQGNAQAILNPVDINFFLKKS